MRREDSSGLLVVMIQLDPDYHDSVSVLSAHTAHRYPPAEIVLPVECRGHESEAATPTPQPRTKG
jgi:hypothetical protein